MESKYLVKISASDANHDWVQQSSIIDENEIPILRKIVSILSLHDNYWPMGESGHPSDIYTWELTDDEIEWFSDLCPESYYLESIEEIILYKIENEETLISKEE